MNEVDIFVEKLEGDAKEWTKEFVEYMRNNYPEFLEVISFQMPTYKLGSGKMRSYIAFGFGANHFSLHCTDFDYIANLKMRLSNGGKGKGCVNVKFTNRDEKEILIQAIDDIIDRHKALL